MMGGGGKRKRGEGRREKGEGRGEKAKRIFDKNMKIVSGEFVVLVVSLVEESLVN